MLADSEDLMVGRLCWEENFPRTSLQGELFKTKTFPIVLLDNESHCSTNPPNENSVCLSDLTEARVKHERRTGDKESKMTRKDFSDSRAVRTVSAMILKALNRNIKLPNQPLKRNRFF